MIMTSRVYRINNLIIEEGSNILDHVDGEDSLSELMEDIKTIIG